MPSRKKDRGKQRKAAKQSSNGFAGRASPIGPQRQRYLRPEIRELMAQGGRLVWRDNGTSSISHPCFKHIKRGNGSDTASAVRNFDRGLLSDEERQELAENYVHNFGQALREGGFDGTNIIMCNMGPHLRQQLGDELLKVDIHLSLIHFLNQSDKSVSDVLGRVVDAGDSTRLPYYWVGILGMLAQYGFLVDAREEARLTVAKGIEPYVMTMMNDKRELFCSKHVWHVCLPPFFALMSRIMKSREAFLVMVSYDGFLPFVAQASCWSQSREDIVKECRMLQLHHTSESVLCPDSLSLSCHEAQMLIALVVAIIRENCDVVEKAELSGALDQIACTPLLSNGPGCTDSTMTGLIRMMNESGSMREQDRKLLLESIIVPLLLKYGYVDARVIAELIEYGRSNSSKEAAEAVLKLMVAILGQDNSYKHIKMIDSRYAAAVRCGLLEFSIDALVAYGDECDCQIGEDLVFITYGLRAMAMHSKTSRALRGRKPEIALALNALRKVSSPQFDEICALINGAVEASSCAVCCNCLKEVDRKELLYCKRCGMECYCSLSCQSESFAMGHGELCKKVAQTFDRLGGTGLSDRELKRIEVLLRNMMMNGCRLVRRKAADFLGEEGNVAEVMVHYGKYPPPGIKVSRSDEGEFSETLKCTFGTPVCYGFAERADLGSPIITQKFVSKKSLAEHGSSN